jgi:DNA mismatch repair protein MutH
LTEKVERRLLAGAKNINGYDAERIAAGTALTAMKELVRCGGGVTWLCELDRAAPRWAGVIPEDHDTWFIHGAGCCV